MRTTEQNVLIPETELETAFLRQYLETAMKARGQYRLAAGYPQLYSRWQLQSNATPDETGAWTAWIHIHSDTPAPGEPILCSVIELDSQQATVRVVHNPHRGFDGHGPFQVRYQIPAGAFWPNDQEGDLFVEPILTPDHLLPRLRQPESPSASLPAPPAPGRYLVPAAEYAMKHLRDCYNRYWLLAVTQRGPRDNPLVVNAAAATLQNASSVLYLIRDSEDTGAINLGANLRAEVGRVTHLLQRLQSEMIHCTAEEEWCEITNQPYPYTLRAPAQPLHVQILVTALAGLVEPLPPAEVMEL